MEQGVSPGHHIWRRRASEGPRPGPQAQPARRGGMRTVAPMKKGRAVFDAARPFTFKTPLPRPDSAQHVAQKARRYNVPLPATPALR
jgi:hypothetical protein